MADLKPPALANDERSTLMALWQFQRESMVRKLEGVSEDDARRALVESGTTLLWLVQHLAVAERLWVLVRFAGQDEASVGNPGRVEDTVAGAVAEYQAAWAEADAVIAGAELDDLCAATADGIPRNLRWVIAHLLEETARHAGHADILRELIDGQTGR